MLDRTVALRLLGAMLLTLWVVLAVAILVAYRPGGPADMLVGGVAFLPALVVGASLVWPPKASDRRHWLAAVGFGIASALLVAPLALLIIDALVGGGRQTLLPSLEVAYAAVLAYASTCAFTALGIAGRLVPATHHLLGRSITAAGIGIGLTLLGSLAFGGVAIANEQQLRERAAPVSVWGPTDPDLVPPSCHEPPTLGGTALLRIEATGSIDGTSVAEALVSGVRRGVTERWTGQLLSRFGDGELDYQVLGETVTWQVDDGPPTSRPVGFLQTLDPDGLTLDGPILAAVTGAEDGPATVAEDLGFALFEGATARHCRRAIGGPTALDAVIALRWIAGEELDQSSDALPEWRGEVDWWVFGDGQLGRATVTISGYPGEAFPGSVGVAAMLQADLSATNRSGPPLRP